MKNKIKVLASSTAAAFLAVGCSGPDEPVDDIAVVEVTEEVVVVEPADEAQLVEYLFVQHADRASLENGVLTLEGVGTEVLYFSDRPERIVGRESLADFIDDWDAGENSFETIPPNAIVTVVRGGESFDLAVVLTEPTLVADNSMTYTVEVLDGPDSGAGENAAVFIDAFGLEPGRPGKPGDPGGLRNGLEPGKPGKPGDPGGLRNGLEPNTNLKGQVNVNGKRGRDGNRNFQGKGNLDRKL